MPKSNETALVIQIHGDDSMTTKCASCNHVMESWYKAKCPGCLRAIGDVLLKFDAFDDEPQVLGRVDGVRG